MGPTAEGTGKHGLGPNLHRCHPRYITLTAYANLERALDGKYSGSECRVRVHVAIRLRPSPPVRHPVLQWGGRLGSSLGLCINPPLSWFYAIIAFTMLDRFFETLTLHLMIISTTASKQNCLYCSVTMLQYVE